jgi:putative tricarboxylic transport membrane protein
MTRDRIAGLGAVVLGVLYVAATFRVPVVEAADATGPRAFPFLVGAMVTGSGLLLLAKDLRAAERRPFAWGFAADRAVWLRIALTAAAGIGYGLVLDRLGYLLATFAFMLVMSSAINARRHLQNLAVAAAFSIVSFVAFGVVLKLSVPRGVLGAVLPF